MIGLELIGIGSLGFVAYKAWRWWIGDLDEPEPRPRLAGEDDQDVDFGAALRSIGGSR